MSKHREQIAAVAANRIEGEILGAAFANPRGATTQGAGGGAIVGEIGARWMGKQSAGAEAVGIQIGKPGALVITPTSLVTLQVKVSATGQVKAVEDVLSVIPLGAVDSLEAKRVGFGGTLTVTAGESSFKLEGKINDLRELVAAFDRAKASA